jgi:hypothetical protein
VCIGATQAFEEHPTLPHRSAGRGRGHPPRGDCHPGLLHIRPADRGQLLTSVSSPFISLTFVDILISSSQPSSVLWLRMLGGVTTEGSGNFSDRLPVITAIDDRLSARGNDHRGGLRLRSPPGHMLDRYRSGITGIDLRDQARAPPSGWLVRRRTAGDHRASRARDPHSAGRTPLGDRYIRVSRLIGRLPCSGKTWRRVGRADMACVIERSRSATIYAKLPSSLLLGWE